MRDLRTYANSRTEGGLSIRRTELRERTRIHVVDQAVLAKQSSETGFTSLAYLMDIDWLMEAYRRTREDRAAGVDGVTAELNRKSFA